MAATRRYHQSGCTGAFSVCTPVRARGANNPGRVALTAMVRLGEHREEIRGGRPASTRPRLDIHDPYAAARDRLGADLDDEPSEATRTHAVASPSTVDRIRCVMITSREVRDRLPHQSTMADEKIEILRGGRADDRSDHAGGLRSHLNPLRE